MDEKVKALMVSLGQAINDSLANSEQLAAAIHELKMAGYDIFFILEATIGFKQRENGGQKSDDSGEPEAGPQAEIRLNFTKQDEKFCRALKITVDNEDKKL